MQITFGIGGRRRAFDISDWNLQYPDEWNIVGRPGLRTFLRRLLLAVLALALAAGLSAPFWSGRDPLLRPLGYPAGALALLAVLFPLSALWESVRIFRRGDRLEVHSFALFPRRRSHPVSSLTGMNLLQREYRSSRRSGHRSLGWRWLLMLHTEADSFEFWCGHHDAEDAAQVVPARVVEFVRRLQHITGLRCAPPQTVAWGSGRQGAFRTGRTFSSTSTPTCQRETYRSLEEMPPELRQAAEFQREHMRSAGLSSMEWQQITVTDSDGNVRTYHSLDEMPPELRKRFEAARRSGS